MSHLKLYVFFLPTKFIQTEELLASTLSSVASNPSCESINSRSDAVSSKMGGEAFPDVYPLRIADGVCVLLGVGEVASLIFSLASISAYKQVLKSITLSGKYKSVNEL